MLHSLGVKTKSPQLQPMWTFSHKSPSPLMFSNLLWPFDPSREFSQLSSSCKPHNPEIPTLSLGGQFSFVTVCSDLTDKSMGPYLRQQTQTIKVFCHRIQSSSLKAEYIVVRCSLK